MPKPVKNGSCYIFVTMAITGSVLFSHLMRSAVATTPFT